MDPVSITVAVTGVVSALSAGVTAFTKWKKNRREKKAQELEETARALEESQVAVSRNYDLRHGALGSLFGEGDSTSLRSMRKTMEKFKRTLIVFMKLQLDLSVFQEAVWATKSETLDAMDQLYRRLRASAPTIPRYLRAKEKECSSSELLPARDNKDTLLVSHPPPASVPGPIVGGPTVTTPERRYEDSPRRLRSHRLRPMPIETYKTSDNLQRDLHDMIRTPISPIRSSVSTAIIPLVPRVTIATFQAALDGLDSELTTPTITRSCPNSPRVLQENLASLLGE